MDCSGALADAFNSDMDKTTGPTEQNLPAAAGSAMSATHSGRSTAQPEPGAAAGTDAMNAYLGGLPAAAAPQSPADPAGTAPSTAAVIVERLQAAVATGVAQFKRLGTDDYSVTLRPDPQTEIVLRISCQDGELSARAELQQGNWAALNAQWGELQERLSRQNVQLAPLQQPAGSNSAALDSRSGSSSSQERPAPRPQTPAAPAVSSLSTSSRRPARAGRAPALAGAPWESWA